MLKRLICIPGFFIGLFALTSPKISAQCTTANLNWDYLEYFYTSTGNYSYVTAAMITTQNFAFGKNMLTVTMGSNITSSGDVSTHTGETGSYGTGDDIYYNVTSVASARTITLTFLSEVSTFKLSLYDIDNSQKITVTAVNAASTAQTVTLSKPGGGNVTIAGSPGTAPTGTGAATNQATTTNTATLNIDIAGPVKTITISISAATGDFWMSDMSACVTESFATNYYTISQPFTGEPAYVLAVHDKNTIFMVDPATGRAVSLFTDNDYNATEINNIAYDPYNKYLYYSIDGAERLTPAGSPDTVRAIKRYDFSTETYSTLVSNVNNSPLYIPTFTVGMESGGAAFYDGCLYDGVEGYFITGTKNTGRESAIWRIDFDGSNNPIRSCMAYAIPCDNGVTNIHDWADFIIKDGVLYDYNSISPGTYTHFNLQTAAVINSYTAASTKDIPKQAGQEWDGTLLVLHDSVGLYNGTTGITSKQKIFSAPGSVTWLPNTSDATEAFRPKADFGDAPSTYDPVALSPAVNEKDTAIRIGAGFSWEWSKKTSVDATGDDYDDGIAYTPVLQPGGGGYVVQCQVYNNKGFNATLCAWLDYNGNGVFDASEAITPITVSSSTASQSFWLYWPSCPNTFTNGQHTFLRVRFTTGTMTSANATGYYLNGETEDYRVLIDNFPLTINLLTFNVNAINNSSTRLNWTSSDEENFAGFGIERSADGHEWTQIAFVDGKNNRRPLNNEYTFDDLHALKGKSYYRLSMAVNGRVQYSEIRTVELKDIIEKVTVHPNPASSFTTLYIMSNENAEVSILVTDMQGRKLKSQDAYLVAGANMVNLTRLNELAGGTYVVQVITPGGIISRKLIINK